MNSQKRENLLNLSLDSTQREREKSKILETGFDPQTGMWEVIVKYHGDISRLGDEIIGVELLNNGYAIITLPENLMDSLSGVEEIEYIEKPKSLIYNDYAVKVESCIVPLTTGEGGLSGTGTLVAVLDSGIDYFLPDFQNQSGSRILYLWDQGQEAEEEKGWLPPAGFQMGVEYTKQQIDEALRAGSRQAGLQIVPQRDISGHGTAVAGIAAGSPSQVQLQGVAPKSDLLIVKLGAPRQGGFPRTTELMRALTYVINKSIEIQRPVAVNLSFGNTYGAHDGSSLLERFIDNASEVGRSVICVGSGNEAASGGHTSGRYIQQVREELSIGQYETSISVQLWKNYSDEIRLTLIAPNGEQYEVDVNQTGRSEWSSQETKVLLYIGMPTPYSSSQEFFFDFIPINEFLTSGIWSFVLTPVRIVTGNYQMYLPGEAVRSRETRFITPNPLLTLTIPSTASKVITVGAYNTTFQSYADFSGRGDLVTSNLSSANPFIKPDLAAPGVALRAPVPGGGYDAFSGTSFSTPVVAGAAALLMEWGIVKGNDPYLYGEKVKAYLIKGARPLQGLGEYPNPQVGWGALCVRDSLPI